MYIYIFMSLLFDRCVMLKSPVDFQNYAKRVSFIFLC